MSYSSLKSLTAIAVGCAVVVGGCSSVPKPVMPDGSSRTAVNTEVGIQRYTALTAEERQAASERTFLGRQVTALKEQVSELRGYLAFMQMKRDQAQPRVMTPAAALAPEPAVSAASTGAGESVEVGRDSIVFRVAQAYAKTDFAPSPGLQSSLLQAARDAKRIDIRGRTDAGRSSAADRSIAARRALNARRWLIGNGIDAAKIHWSSLGAGGFVVDNSTVEGKARNRRVEIEAMGLDAGRVAGGWAMAAIGSSK